MTTNLKVKSQFYGYHFGTELEKLLGWYSMGELNAVLSRVMGEGDLVIFRRALNDFVRYICKETYLVLN